MALRGLRVNLDRLAHQGLRATLALRVLLGNRDLLVPLDFRELMEKTAPMGKPV